MTAGFEPWDVVVMLGRFLEAPSRLKSGSGVKYAKTAELLSRSSCVNLKQL